MPERSLILQASIRLVFHTAVLFSLFLLFAGHNSPGGGFVGGLVAGIALVLLDLSDGMATVRRMVRVTPATLLAVGLGAAVVTAAVPWFSGGEVLESAYANVDLPLFGEVKVVSVLGFDIGVYLVVVGLVFMALDTLGEEAEL